MGREQIPDKYIKRNQTSAVRGRELFHTRGSCLMPRVVVYLFMLETSKVGKFKPSEFLARTALLFFTPS